MSEISNFWLSVLISQVAPYLMFILVSKSTHPVSLVLSSQNAQCFYISAPLKIQRKLHSPSNHRYGLQFKILHLLLCILLAGDIETN